MNEVAKLLDAVSKSSPFFNFFDLIKTEAERLINLNLKERGAATCQTVSSNQALSQFILYSKLNDKMLIVLPISKSEAAKTARALFDYKRFFQKSLYPNI